MSLREFDLINTLLRPLAGDPAARGLLSDTAVLASNGADLVLTKDMMAEGVHFLPDDPPESIGWRLVVVNASDLAATGAVPRACLLGLGLGRTRSRDWVEQFLDGLRRACTAFGLPLIGGDTICPGDTTVLSLTAIGSVSTGRAMARTGAQPGDTLWVSGTIGDAGAGLALAQSPDFSSDSSPEAVCLRDRYWWPQPRLALGLALCDLASAAADVSDGLLADAGHIASASGVAAEIEAAAIPLSPAYVSDCGDTLATRVRAATAGDDYELVFTAPAHAATAILALSQRLGLTLTPIGRVSAGSGVRLLDAEGADVPVERTGFEHHYVESTTESPRQGED